MTNRKSRTSLVLMELIIIIMFFSLASAVCVQLFVMSHLITKETKALNNAINITQSISEVMNGTDGSINSIKEYYPSASGDSDYFVIYYDKDFNETEDINNAEYAADVTVTSVGNLHNMNVDFLKYETYETLYSLKSSKYIRKIYNN